MNDKSEYDKIYYRINKEKKKEYNKKRYLTNKEKILGDAKIYYRDNKEKILKREKVYYTDNVENILKYKKEYYSNNIEKIEKYRLNHQEYYSNYNKEYQINNKEEISKNKRQYYISNRKKIIERGGKYKKNRCENDHFFKLTQNIRSLIRSSLKKNGCLKPSKTENILGCTFNEFKLHLESKFEPWMNWSNRGNWNGQPKELNVAWDIDHIVPLSSATTEEELIRLNHYTNLQPLCSYYNRHIKGNNTKHILRNDVENVAV